MTETLVSRGFDSLGSVLTARYIVIADTYERLGHEDDNDLVPLCARHHRQLHRVMEESAGWRRLGRRHASAGIIGLLRQDDSATRAVSELGEGGS